MVSKPNASDARASTLILNEEEMKEKRLITDELWSLQRRRDSLIYQKSRSSWIKAGDTNPSFFHSCINFRRKKNNTVALSSGYSWVEGVVNIRAEMKSYFQEMFSESCRPKPNLDGLPFGCLSLADNLALTASFSIDEVRDAVWSCQGDKSPGLDGYNFTFFKKFWSSLSYEVCLLVEEFHSSSSLPKGVCSSLVALVPNKENPQKVSDYRPISLIGNIHKIISKLLAIRLNKVIRKLISKSQSAFISNGQIMDEVLAINEIVDLAKKKGQRCFILKVDFEKAYDSVSWVFLKYMLGRMGFCDKWLAWMNACVLSGHVSVLVIGGPPNGHQAGRLASSFPFPNRGRRS